jgi:hypothetical protein
VSPTKKEAGNSFGHAFQPMGRVEPLVELLVKLVVMIKPTVSDATTVGAMLWYCKVTAYF